MQGEPTNCPICRQRASKSFVPNKMDSRIECSRCGWFDIDHVAEVNLHSSKPPNFATLSGIARHRYELERFETIPRLVWRDLEEDRNGLYEFEDLNSIRMTAQEKATKFLALVAAKTESTAGEEVELSLPSDLSLAFAKSEKELNAILDYLASRELIAIQSTSDSVRTVSLTITGADAGAPTESFSPVAASVELQPLDVVITGSKQASGAFGEVYPGIQKRLNRKVAIKIIQPNTKPDAVAHALGLAKVNHPNVVTVHDVGTVIDPNTGEAVDCVVMEWIDGVKIHEAWSELSQGDAKLICGQIVDGVRAMHSKDVCHNDLHSGNVMLASETVKIVDIHYTESAHFSQLSTQPRELLVQHDCTKVAGLIRLLLLNSCPGVLDSSLGLQLCKSQSLDEVESVVESIFLE